MPVPRITREDLKARLDAGNAPVLVDVRLKYPFEHSTVKLPGAIRIFPDATDFAVLPKDRDIVVYDSDPDEIVSARVAARLLSLGYKAMALKGGITDWMGANLPTEGKDAVRPPAPAGKADA